MIQPVLVSVSVIFSLHIQSKFHRPFLRHSLGRCLSQCLVRESPAPPCQASDLFRDMP